MKKGQYIICRTYSAGVFAGNLVYRKGREVKLNDARRLWYWDGAASLSQLSQEGVKSPGNCKFPTAVPYVILLDAIELLPTTGEAETSIKGVPIWKR